MELVQALQLAAFWYRLPKHHLHLPLFQLIQLARETSEAIGIRDPNCSISLEPSETLAFTSSGDAWRAWIASYLYSAHTGVSVRVPHPVVWSSYVDLCIFSLDYWTYGLSTDRLLCQFARAARVCDQIASKLGLIDFNSFIDVADPVNQLAMHHLQGLITDWKAQIPASLNCASLQMWELAATIQLHECVLHTATNKQSFGGPFVAERLSVTDFPTPVVTSDHVLSLHTLRASCHALLNLFFSLDIPTFLSFPPMFSLVQSLYAQWILVKLYVSVTALGNSYGGFIDAGSLELDQYLARIMDRAVELSNVDSKCVQARILQATSRIKEWVCAYDESYAKQGAAFAGDFTSGSASFLGPDAFGLGENSAINWEIFIPPNEPFGNEFEDLFGYST